MPYQIIRGEFHIYYPDSPRQGPEPDGDTIKFRPDDPSEVWRLQKQGERGPSFNGRQMVNLRFEGIDALETHYKGMHQNVRWAIAARDLMLELTGFGEIEFWENQPYRVRQVEHHPVRGYILCRSLDSHGRVISFIYTGEPPVPDKDEVFLDTAEMEKSLNSRLLATGMVYPSFYVTLPLELRKRLRQLTIEARSSALGLWPEETASLEQSARISDLHELQPLVIWPKLFRRLANYFASGRNGLAGFDAWLREDPIDRDDRIMLPTGEFGNIHDLLKIDQNNIQMLYRPEDFIIFPDNA